ncbi:sensor histidine kinase [Fimbriimonas ginsengisoli]|uniref:histidine kinase n=1 Tax=Fimbriimonas ginsengisoli Gsoil 348 TaxID=661478 RepID=A0A068NQC0_FIMGI|nr:HAMP domain-containing sensor histidine kinase [Fimbriimonas ginsengisoli]AIE83814.1 Putative two somponent system sensor kinase protein [Fimbriimonas ginsengisoli Gsoil 348]
MKTVRARLTGFTILVVAGILVLMGAFVRFRVERNLIGEIDRQLRSDAGAVRTTPTDGKFDLPPPPETQVQGKAGIPAPGIPFLDEGPRGFGIPQAAGAFSAHHDVPFGQTVMEVLRSNKSEVRLEANWSPPRLIPVFDRGEAEQIHPIEDPIGYQRAKAGSVVFNEYQKAGAPMRSLTAPVRQGSEVVAYVQAVRPLTPVRHQLADLDRALATSIPVAILLAAIGGALLVGSAMRPLRRMTESAKRLEEDLSSSRLPVEGADEFAELASTINLAFDRTSAAFASQSRALAQLERFTGDAGHELRTPLASIKTNASYLLHMADLPQENLPPVRMIDLSADRMSKLISDLLLLARQDGAKAVLKPTEVNVDHLVRSVVENLATSEEIGFQILVPSNLTVCADLDAVERVLVNLTSNAAAYARTGVTIAAEASAGYLIVKVDDDGEGIAPEHIDRLAERFFRPDESRSRLHGGVGLGLAIVKSLTESHGGGLQISSEVGKGTSVCARFRLGG